jgi:hypothetical protein
MTAHFRVLWGGDPQYWHEFDGNGDFGLCNSLFALKPSHIAPVKSTAIAEARAYANLMKQIRAMQVQVSGPTFIGELRQTLHMLKHPADKLVRGFREYLGALRKRKRSRRHDDQWINEVGGLWLEYSFGWQPLLHDIEDAYKAYRRIGEAPRGQKLSTGAESLFDRNSECFQGDLGWLNSIYNLGNGLGYKSATDWFIEKHTVRYRAAISASARMTTWNNVGLFGFRLDEFVPTAWELLPWSFLIDYFTNIGDLLSQSVTDTSRVRYVNKTIIKKSSISGWFQGDGKQTAAYVGGNATWTGSSSRAKYSMSRRTIDRQAGVGLQQQNFRFDIDLSSGQLANIAALLSQAVGVHPQRGIQIRDPRFRTPR